MAFNFFRRKEKILTNEQQLLQWEQSGKPAPPPHIIKQQIIKDYQFQFQLNTLVETGTYLGDMIEAQRTHFLQLYSIELSAKLHKKAVERFNNFEHIKILQGDSGVVLNRVVPEFKEPALFWLDGHYSGGITALGTKECPVPEELQIIFESTLHHVILIDDARLFNGSNSYPTLKDIDLLIKTLGKNYSIRIEDDIIRLTHF